MRVVKLTTTKHKIVLDKDCTGRHEEEERQEKIRSFRIVVFIFYMFLHIFRAVEALRIDST